jgi:hypothetical protein
MDAKVPHTPFTRWNDYEVDVFLESYRKHILNFKGKELWSAIQSDLLTHGYRKSLWTLEKKWNNLLRRFRKGGNHDNFAHYHHMVAIFDEKREREYTPSLSPTGDGLSGDKDQHLREWEENVLFEAQHDIQQLIDSYEREIKARNESLGQLVAELESLIKEPSLSPPNQVSE